MTCTLPDRRYAPPRPWQPLSDAEWEVLEPFAAHSGAGRPVRDPCRRPGALFRLAAQPGPARPWTLPRHALPARFGKPDPFRAVPHGRQL